MRKIVLYLLLVISYNVRAQDMEEKPYTFMVNVAGGIGLTNYYFHSNSPRAPYTAPELNEAFIFSLPFKANLMYHHPVMNVGAGLDERKINIGVGLKRLGLTGNYYDYDSTEYVDIQTSLYKITGRIELILIQHERGERTNGFGFMVEAGSSLVRNPIGRPLNNGFCLNLGGFYFHQLAQNLFLYLEAGEGYDRYKTIINQGYSTHTLYTTEIMIGVRVKL